MKTITLLLSSLIFWSYSVSAEIHTKGILRGTKLERPVVLPPTNVTPQGFTANWEKVDSAEAYCVFVYTEHNAVTDEKYTVLHEDFDKITFGDINNPVWSEELYENLDIYTSLPNWSVYGYTTFVKGMVGGIVYSPYIDLRNNDGVYDVTVSVYGVSGDEIFIESDGIKEEQKSFKLTETGITQKTFTFTNGRKDTFFKIHNTTGTEAYVDEVTVTQDLKAGDKAYVYVALNDAVPGNETSADFKKLSYAEGASEVFYDLYAVVRVYNDPEHPDRYDQIYSDFSEMMNVVLDPSIDTKINESKASAFISHTSEGIMINLDKSSYIRVFNASGSLLINRHMPAGSNNIYLKKGLYIINIENNIYKTII